MRTIMEDNRPIDYISSEDANSIFYRVGFCGISGGPPARVTVIEPYEENGEMAKVTWFAVRGLNYNEIIARVPARLVQVVYKVDLAGT